MPLYPIRHSKALQSRRPPLKSTFQANIAEHLSLESDYPVVENNSAHVTDLRSTRRASPPPPCTVPLHPQSEEPLYPTSEVPLYFSSEEPLYPKSEAPL